MLKAFASIRVGGANIYITLSDDRERTSSEFERQTAPKLRQIADARVYFRSQQGFGNRDVGIMLSGDDPVKLEQAANALVQDMKKMPRGEGAARSRATCRRPEITITPRFDLAADMGVTTAALSQTIRIATQGEIDQNSAKFSLSDRQIPIRVSLERGIAPEPVDDRESAGADRERRLGAAEGRRRDRLRRRPDPDPALQPAAPDRRRRRPRAGRRRGDEQDHASCPPTRTCRPACEHARQGEQKMQQELISNFIMAVVAGIFLVFAVLVLLYKRIVPPFVNMGSLLLAPLGGAIALHLTGNAMSMPVLIGILMLLGIVAKNSILLIDFAHRGDGQGRREARGDRRRRPQARPADRDDHGGDGRRNDAHRHLALGRRQLARADGHRRDRRPDPVDRPDPGHRPGRLQPRRQLRALARARSSGGCSPTAAPRTTARRRCSRRSDRSLIASP